MDNEQGMKQAAASLVRRLENLNPPWHQGGSIFNFDFFVSSSNWPISLGAKFKVCSFPSFIYFILSDGGMRCGAGVGGF